MVGRSWYLGGFAFSVYIVFSSKTLSRPLSAGGTIIWIDFLTCLHLRGRKSRLLSSVHQLRGHLCRTASLFSSVIVALAIATSSDATKSITLALKMFKLAPRLTTWSWASVKDFEESLWTRLSMLLLLLLTLSIAGRRQGVCLVSECFFSSHLAVAKSWCFSFSWRKCSHVSLSENCKNCSVFFTCSEDGFKHRTETSTWISLLFRLLFLLFHLVP